MKDFRDISCSAAEVKRELMAFRQLLDAKDKLWERKDIKPFFEGAANLSAFIGTFAPDIGAAANRLAYEFEIGGDFSADIVVGNTKEQTYCMVELEEGAPDGIFRQHPNRSTKEWSRQFERGFSQLVDWFFALDGRRGDSARFEKDFGYGHVKFHGVLVIGRSAGLSDYEVRRLRWREERIQINNHPINCVTYDELHDILMSRLAYYSFAATSS
jgi:hypothetical protein